LAILAETNQKPPNGTEGRPTKGMRLRKATSPQCTRTALASRRLRRSPEMVS
jgi:hypothetical protein